MPNILGFSLQSIALNWLLKGLFAIATLAAASAYSATEVAEDPLIFLYNSSLTEPYIFRDGKDVVGGIHWDLAHAIGAHLKHPVDLLEVPRRRTEQYLLDGQAHVHLLTNPLWKAKPEAFQWTERIYTEYDQIVESRFNIFAVESVEDLAGKRLGTIQGFVYQDIFEEPYRSVIIRDDAKTFRSNFIRLGRQRIDALIAPKTLIDYLFLKEFNRKRFHVVSSWSIRHDLFSAVSKKSPISANQLSRAYQLMQSNGEIEAIFNKYR